MEVPHVVASQIPQSPVEQTSRPGKVPQPRPGKVPQPGERINRLMFGMGKWNQYFGEVGTFGEVDAEPRVPSGIEDILASPCSFWTEKKVEETHKLVLVPHTFNEAPLTLDSLRKLMSKFKKDNATEEESGGMEINISPIVTEHCEEIKPRFNYPYWILMTNKTLDRSEKQNYAMQQQRVTSSGYDVPHLLEAAVCIIADYAEHAEKGSESMFFKQKNSNKKWTYTRCHEKVHYLNKEDQTIIGGGVNADSFLINEDDGRTCGIAAVRFFESRID